jgi:hypothetical protein
MRALTVVLAAAMSLATAADVRGQAASMDLALSRPLTVSVTSAPVGDVLTKLSQVSGVKIVLDPDTTAFLPYGSQTRLGVRMTDISLRDGLGQVLAPSALQWVVDDGSVRVLPNDALYRLSRRATFEELEMLGRLHTGALTVPTGTGVPLLEQIRIIAHEPKLNIVYKAPGDTDSLAAAATEQASKQLPASPARFLDAMTAVNDWTWYLAGKDIIVLPRKDQVERQLQRQVTLRYKNEQLITVLKDLAKQAHVQLDLAPGVLALVPAEMRSNYTLVMADATVAQTLEIISGMTGLVFERTSNGLLVQPSKMLQQPTSAPAKRPYLIRTVMKINGQELEVFLRSDELPEDVQDAITAEKNKFIEKLRSNKTTQPTN